ncbi:MAG TPA: DUF1842 domain-containing protein [Paraburkholderia sp.]|nr:DUF1842 domain-containing protein [Paraburkholderia sp.]
MTVGLFPVNFRVATPAIGAPVLTLTLLVNTPGKRVSGVARITQTTYPPLHFQADVWGTFSPVTVESVSEADIVLSLAGNPSGPTSGLAETFQFHGILKGDWKSGAASYRYFEGGNWHEIEHAIITPESLLQPLKPPFQPYTPLYGVGIQQATASGDLSRMKALASEAEQQLANSDQLKSALASLNAEIARLEAAR